MFAIAQLELVTVFVCACVRVCVHACAYMSACLRACVCAVCVHANASVLCTYGHAYIIYANIYVCVFASACDYVYMCVPA